MYQRLLILKTFLAFFYACILLSSGILQAQHHAQWFFSPVSSGLHTRSASVGDGTFIVAASTSSSVNSNLTIMRVNACGNLLWAKKWSSQKAEYGRVNNVKIFGNEIFVFGCIKPLLPDTAGVLTVLNLQGNHLWSKTYHSPEWEFWLDLDVNYKGELFLTGNNNSNTHHGVQIIKLSHKGELMWSNSYTQSEKTARGVATSDGGFLRQTGNTAFKVDDLGNPDWIFDYSNMRFPVDVAPLEVENGYILISESYQSDWAMRLIKINHQGNLIWESKVVLSSWPLDLISDATGNIYLIGNNRGKNWLIKFDAWGEVLNSYELSSGYSDLAERNGHLHIFQNAYSGSAPGIRQIKLPMLLPDTGLCLPTIIDSSQFIHHPVSRVASSFNATPLTYPLTVDELQVNLLNWPASSQLLCENISAIPDSLDLGADTAFCPQGSIMLGAKNEVLGEYLWSTGAKTSNITVSTPGVYWLEVNAGCGQKIMRDSIQIDEYRLKKLDFTLEGQPSVLDSVIVGLKSTNFLQASWYVNDTLAGAGKDLKWRFSRPGAHIVKACYTNLNECINCDSLRIIVPEEKLHLPNAFSPNGDGLNDHFGPDESAVHSYQLTLFARTGQEIKSLNNQPWDGKHKGQVMNQGVYLYRLTYQFYKGDRERILNGHVTILQ